MLHVAGAQVNGDDAGFEAVKDFFCDVAFDIAGIFIADAVFVLFEYGDFISNGPFVVLKLSFFPVAAIQVELSRLVFKEADDFFPFGVELFGVFAREAGGDEGAEFFLFEGDDRIDAGFEDGVMEFEKVFSVDEVIVPSEYFSKVFVQLIPFRLDGRRFPQEQCQRFFGKAAEIIAFELGPKVPENTLLRTRISRMPA